MASPGRVGYHVVIPRSSKSGSHQQALLVGPLIGQWRSGPWLQTEPQTYDSILA